MSKPLRMLVVVLVVAILVGTLAILRNRHTRPSVPQVKRTQASPPPPELPDIYEEAYGRRTQTQGNRNTPPLPSPSDKQRPPLLLDQRLRPQLLVDLATALRLGDMARVQELMGELRKLVVPEKQGPGDQNAALVYEKAKMAFEELGMSKEDIEFLDAVFRGEAPDPEQLERARALLQRAGPVLDLIGEAVKKPYALFPVKYEDGFAAELPHIAFLIRAEKLRATAQKVGLLSGSDATSFGISKDLKNESFLVGQLVRHVIQTIEFDALGKSGQMNALANIHVPNPAEVREGLTRSYYGETYGVLQTLSRGMSLDPSENAKPMGNLNDIEVRLAAAYYVEQMSDMVALAGQPYYKIPPPEALEGFPTLPPPSSDAGKAIGDCFPVISKAFQNAAKAESQLAILRVAQEVEVYRQANGAYPQNLDWLGTGIPVDPFTGKSFEYAFDDKGFQLKNGAPNEKSGVTFRWPPDVQK